MKVVRTWYQSECGNGMCCLHPPTSREEVTEVKDRVAAYELIKKTSPEVVRITENRFGGVTGLIHHYEIIEDGLPE